MFTQSLRSLVLAPLVLGPLLSAGGCDSVGGSEEVETAGASDALTIRTGIATTDLVAASGSRTVVPVSGSLTVSPPPGGNSVGSDLETLHPWDVRIGGTGGLSCRGILIHPSWVLTAAHCIGPYPGTVSFSRTDPATGMVSTDSQSFDAAGRSRGMFVHPSYVPDSGFGQPQNDIALIRLASPFQIDRNIQTAGLPRAAANPGRTGMVATNNHTTLPAGSTAVVRAAQLSAADCAAPSGFFCIRPPAGSLCRGDSGSGFTELLDGRATVVGLLSNISGGDDCIAADKQAELTDVYAYESWILSTVNLSLEGVAGRVRVRASEASNGTLSLTCISANGAPVQIGMNVPGGEIAIDCDDASVVCGAPSGRSLTGFSLRTIAPNGSATVQALPYLPAFTATYADPGASFLQYTCSVSTGITAVSAATTATLAL